MMMNPMMNQNRPKSLSRRHMLERSSMGFGTAVLAALLAESRVHADDSSPPPTTLPGNLPLNAGLKRLHHVAKAKHVIFCFMSGGVSHVDSFDPKPLLGQLHGKPMPTAIARTQFNNNGNVMASPFEFAKFGQSGIEVSSLFPHISKWVDELAIVRSMTTPVNEHAQGNFFMHTGFPFMGFPSVGAWCSYGLGSENENLPSYVVLQSGHAIAPHGGLSLFSNGFLPAKHQGSVLKADVREAVRNIVPQGATALQRNRLNLTQTLGKRFWDQTGGNADIDAAIGNYELAFRMQTAVPEVCDISGESERTRRLYGLDSGDTEMAAYGRQCLLARRLVEKGVRFVELSCLTKGIGAGGAANPWDQHGDLAKGHQAMAQQVDQPIAALIEDLKDRGLLAETLIIWAGEFGRTPFSQGSNGRDHNPMGFSVWLAGGGTRGGTVHGATDELGYYAVENRCEVYDLWATVLHLLGVNHEKLTFRHGGRDHRLTDVHGNVIRAILG
jgi:hypothetical protein